MNEEKSLGRRKEPRYKAGDDQALQCDCVVNQDDPREGAVIDISSSGLRFLCDGNFSVGQTLSIELKADQSYGTFGGVIRRVEPWAGGQCLLGCELTETIAADTLEALARQGIVNRRRADRMDWNHAAKMSWELQPGEIEIEIHDCSSEGLKVSSQIEIPDNVLLRIRVDTDNDEQVVIDARTAWQFQQEHRSVAGLVFHHREVPESLTRILAQGDGVEEAVQPINHGSSIRSSLLVAATIVVVGVTMIQTGWLP